VRIAHRRDPPSHTILYPNSKKRKEIFNGVPRAIADFVKNLLSGLVLILGIRIASAQAVSIGIKGGIPIGGTIGQQDESRPYIVGPSVEVRLPAGFAIEVDALYRRIGNTTAFSFTQGDISSSFVNRERGNYWQFPVLGKYYFKPRNEAWQPFVGTGYALRVTGFHFGGTSTNNALIPPGQSSQTLAQTSTFHSDYRSGVEFGALVSAGVRFHTGRFALAPEIRYTRWATTIPTLLAGTKPRFCSESASDCNETTFITSNTRE
jgi:hypothetical protein